MDELTKCFIFVSMEKHTLFYDGNCGLCHKSVSFVLKRDKNAAFSFSPIGSNYFNTQFTESEIENFPDSIIVKNSHGIFLESDAVKEIFKELSGIWKIAWFFLAIIPRFLRNFGYRFIAGIRRSIFKDPNTNCPIIPPELKQRFHL